MAARKKNLTTQSIQTQVQAFRDADKSFEWPALVRLPEDTKKKEYALAQYAQITQAKPRSEWIEYELTAAANLALVEANIAELLERVNTEGPTIPSPNNPLIQIRNGALDSLSVCYSLRAQGHKQLGLTFTNRQTLKNQLALENKARALTPNSRLLAGGGDDFFARGPYDDLLLA